MAQFKKGDRIRALSDSGFGGSVTTGMDGVVELYQSDTGGSNEGYLCVFKGYTGNDGYGGKSTIPGSRYMYPSEIELISSTFSTRSQVRKNIISKIRNNE